MHRQDMHEKELRDGIEQLALVGVTAAQMTKRLAVPRHTVDAALKVVNKPASKERMDTESLFLEDAAIYAEFSLMWTRRAVGVIRVRGAVLGVCG